MHSKSDNLEVMISYKPEEVIKVLFQSLFSRCQIGLEISMRVSDFMFDCVHLSYFNCHKTNVKRGGSYIDSPDWIKSKKSNKSHQ